MLYHQARIWSKQRHELKIDVARMFAVFPIFIIKNNLMIGAEVLFWWVIDSALS